jgi:hypothetical protein
MRVPLYHHASRVCRRLPSLALGQPEPVVIQQQTPRATKLQKETCQRPNTSIHMAMGLSKLMRVAAATSGAQGIGCNSTWSTGRHERVGLSRMSVRPMKFCKLQPNQRPTTRGRVRDCMRKVTLRDGRAGVMSLWFIKPSPHWQEIHGPVYELPAFLRVVVSQSRPSYKPSPDVAHVDWMYQARCRRE